MDRTDALRRQELARYTDGQLLAATRDVPEAFQVFYERHASAVLSYLAYRTGDTEVALDLTSEVFLAALVGARGYQPARGPARGWLLGIANKHLSGERRRRVRERDLRRKLGVRWFEFTDRALEQAEEVIEPTEDGFLAGMGSLTERERQAVQARILDVRDYADIAAAERASEAAIRQRVSRGLSKLRAVRKRRSG
jgi:RNA polymerase sigma factor (sigma-70 family)